MKISYEPTGVNNFHNSPPINLIISGIRDLVDNELYVITSSQANRIKSHFCGVKDCHCPEGAIIQLDPDGRTYGIHSRYCKE